MSADFPALAATALFIGFLHTLVGPDHYVPFVAMSRVRGWSWNRTIAITLLCGLAHVLGSAVLGVVGILLGWLVVRVEEVEGFRGNVAAWLLCGFGLAYFAWGIVKIVRQRRHRSEHGHSHSHVDGSESSGTWGMTPWILFTIFLFGPCEPLIPLLMYPAAQGSFWAVAAVTLLFALATLVTMTAMVIVLRFGTFAVRLPSLERYHHALAGLVLFACGVAIISGL